MRSRIGAVCGGGVRGTSAALASVAGAVGGGSSAIAQCQEWAGLGDTSLCSSIVSFDESGAGAPAVFAGGYFTAINGVSANGVARWSNGAWTRVGKNTVGGGVNPARVGAIAVFDEDGPGEIAPALFVGGTFSSADGVAVTNVARWDGAGWSPVGVSPVTSVRCLFVYDADGEGPGPATLIASGANLVDVPSITIASWNGNFWEPMDVGAAPGFASHMALFDEDGPGPAAPTLYATLLGVNLEIDPPLIRWNGFAWEPAPLQPYAVGQALDAMVVLDPDGPGPAPNVMYCGRSLAFEGESAFMALSPGAGWTPIGPYLNPGEQVTAACAYDRDGAGPGRTVLMAGFRASSGEGLAQFDGNIWSVPAGAPNVGSVDPEALASIVDHSGAAGTPAPSLFVGLHGLVPPGNGGLVGSGILRLRVDRSEIALSAPGFVTAPVGASASFHVDANTGSPVITYGWRKNGEALVDGGAISGAGTDTLTIDPVAPDDKGIYACVVATDCATALSRPALLDVPAVDPCPTDTNGDMVIDFFDLNNILSLYGVPCP